MTGASPAASYGGRREHLPIEHGHNRETRLPYVLIPPRPYPVVAVVLARVLSEQVERYPYIIAPMGPKLRVIECRDRLQWIVQKRIGTRWRGVSYHRDREVLIKRWCWSTYALRILRALPRYHVGGAHG